MSNIYAIDCLTKQWADKLQLTAEHNIKNSAYNIHLILSNHEDWRDQIRYDEFEQRTKLNGVNWQDHNTSECKTWFSGRYEIEPSMQNLDASIELVAREHSYHPVREYLQSLKWDGKERLTTFLIDIFGADKSPENLLYNSEVGRMWMISAVARVMIPGCQADSALILISEEQGLGKSTACKILGKGWSADSTIDIGSKDSMQNINGVWIYELAELSSVRSARDIETVKQFISSRFDRYRSSYGRRAADHPRQVVFIGSTNNAHCLHDTQNRRFWPVDVATIDLDRLSKEVDQLWAEASVRYQNGEIWYPRDEKIKELIRTHGTAHTEIDPWQSPIAEHLAKEPLTNPKLLQPITSEYLLTDVIKIPVKDQTRAHQMRIGLVMKSLGYTSKQVMEDNNRERRWVKN